MPLTGLDIYKLLPQTNCGDCGVPTCLAFAMKVASKQAPADRCPHLTAQSRQALGAAAAPPQAVVRIGSGRVLEVGGETVMFRHEEKFHRPCGVAVLVGADDDLDAKAEAVRRLRFERMGQTIAVDCVAVWCGSGDGEHLKRAAVRLNEALGLPMVLIADSEAKLAPAAEALRAARPLLWEPRGPCAETTALAARLSLPLVVEGTLDQCADAAERARAAGVEQIMLCPGEVGPREALEFLTISRRAALRHAYRPLGYPVLVYARSQDPVQLSLEACQYVLKYAGLVVLDADEPEYLLPVLVCRQGIYTDPQRPVQVQAGVHDVNGPGERSPLLVTTNFSLTFYSVLSEVESSRVPARILAVDTKGTSVLTAWAADQFGPHQITDAIRRSGVFERLADGWRRPVIPGLVAVISGELSDELGEEVIVGPREASGLRRFLREEWPRLVRPAGVETR